MRPETAIVEIHSQYKVHTEFYGNPEAKQTIILVNGSLSTTASFAQTVKYLQPHFNVVLFDEPYAGQSKPHNDNTRFISKETEADILLHLIEHFRVDYLMSFSWGSVSALLALAQCPARIKKAVITSFSPILNDAMMDYLTRGLDYLAAVDRDNVGHLVNDTIGKYLPSLYKRFNHKHCSSLDDHEYLQMHYHVRQVLNMDSRCYVDCLQNVDIPMLFVNGEHDEYTSAADARHFAKHVRDCEFVTIDNAGHFVDVEHKAGWLQTQQALLGFLKAPVSSSLARPQPVADYQAIAV
ncbi:alpha/beta fold hydrolase [Pseudomonas boanensis]|uniref:alpha/beta fold hydrolase n=1 Tax=Metapseudomonas boanensis TaxID=2822138 RepID=UPI0035D50C4C